MKLALSPRSFKRAYPIEEETLEETSESKVYFNDKHAVKVARLDWIISDICFMSQIEHPKIMPMLHYSFNLDKKEKSIALGTYAMPKGDPLEIKTFEQCRYLTYDILEAVSYLFYHNLVHCDIKPDNIVSMKTADRDKYILIDFGLCRGLISTSSGLMMQGIAYTEPFRDYQFYGEYNLFNCELYAIGQTIRSAALLENHIYDSSIDTKSFKEQLRKLYPDTKNKDIDEFVDIVRLLMSDPESRPDIDTLLEHPFLKDVTCPPNKLSLEKSSSFNYSPTKVNLDKEINKEMWYEILIKIMFPIPFFKRISLRALFLALHNVHRCSSIVTETNLETIVYINVYLVSRILRCSKQLHFHQIINMEESPQDSLDLLSKVLKELNNIVFVPTCWDNCENLEQLLIGFAQVLDYDYKPNYKNFSDKKHQVSTTIDTLFELLFLPNDWREIRKLIEERLFKLKRPTPIRSTHSLKTIEHDTDRSVILQKLSKRNGIQRVSEMFDADLDVGFVYQFSDIISENNELAFDIISKILDVESPLIERYYELISSTKINKLIKHKSKLRAVSKKVNLLSSPIEEILDQF